jgi:hypothetical protein
LHAPVSRHGGYITLLKSDGETTRSVTTQAFHLLHIRESCWLQT